MILTYLRRSMLSGVGLILTVAACGGSAPTSKMADEAPETDASDGERKSGIRMSSELGGLNEAKVNETFESSIRELQGCLSRGANRIEFLGGAVSFFLEVDEAGQVSQAYLEQSSLGDRKTEKCMLGALKTKSWPKPVGGKVGHARKSFDFDPPNDVRPPTEWGSENVEKALAEKASAIDECKDGSRGTFTATMYVDTEGNPIAVGVTPPDADGERAVDCLVDVLKQSQYPSPGSWPAKVTFSL